MLKGIIFDFDGVICESVDVKTQAFRKLFSHYPAHLDTIIKFHMVNGGMSRFEKFKIIYRDYLKEELTEAKSKELGEQFTKYSYDAVIQAPLVKGAGEFLEENYRKLALFVVSGTPEEEMRSIVCAKKLEKYFKAVYGSPRSKAELINIILSLEKFKPNEVVFVGDSITDQNAAKKTGIRFMGRIYGTEPADFGDISRKDVIGDLQDLREMLCS